MHADGDSLAAIARTLAAEQIAAAQGGVRWSVDGQSGAAVRDAVTTDRVAMARATARWPEKGRWSDAIGLRPAVGIEAGVPPE